MGQNFPILLHSSINTFFLQRSVIKRIDRTVSGVERSERSVCVKINKGPQVTIVDNFEHAQKNQFVEK